MSNIKTSLEITFMHWDRFQGELTFFENMENRTASIWSCLGRPVPESLGQTIWLLLIERAASDLLLEFFRRTKCELTSAPFQRHFD